MLLTVQFSVVYKILLIILSIYEKEHVLMLIFILMVVSQKTFGVNIHTLLVCEKRYHSLLVFTDWN